MLRNLLPLTLLHAYLNAFEHFEAFRNYDIPILRFAAVQYFPGIHKGIDPVNFLIPQWSVKQRPPNPFRMASAVVASTVVRFPSNEN